MSTFRSQKTPVTIKGVLQIPFRSSGSEGSSCDSSEEDEDDDLNDDFFSYAVDFNNFVSARKPKETKVAIKSYDGKVHYCTGRFPLTQVFWRVEVKVANGYLKQAPKYYILNDTEMIKNCNLITIFISECLKKFKINFDKEEHAVKACFEAYCRVTGEDNLTFHNVEKIFKEYFKLEKTGCCLGRQGESNFGEHALQDHSHYMMNYVVNSELGSVVLLAASHPELVATCSVLLPYSFTQFLHKLRKSKTKSGSSFEDRMMEFIHSEEVEQKIKDADEMARERPWEFAFKDIIAKKLRIYGTEARLQTYIQAGYLPKTPQTEKDAMYIYEVLKEDARRNGNMYMELNQIKQSLILKRLNYSITSDTRWEAALVYLEDNDVIKREVFNFRINIFLRANWQAEVDTVYAFNTILCQHKVKPLIWDIDLSSPDFSYLKHDEGQMKATRLISQMPITVLSGKGGCGKTTVVTRLLKYLCDREELRLKEEEETCEGIDDSYHLGHSDVPSPDVSLAERSAQNILLPEVNNPKIKTASTAVSTQQTKPKNPVFSSQISHLEKFRQEVVSDLIKVLESTRQRYLTELKEEILLTAPTGKAARLLGHKSKLPSATLHSVVMSWRHFLNNKYSNDGAENKTWIYNKVKILVIDECSLVSVRLFASVINILLEEANLQKIILLGDVRQLPSIEPGEFLKDVFQSFRNVTDDGFGFSVELTQNHRSESELIVENAANISNCRMPTFNREGRFYLKEISANSDDNERDQAIRHLLKNFEDVRSDVNSQFVSFRNAHCKAVNELCCKFYNNHSIEVCGSGRKVKYDFQIGDKICLGKNGNVTNSRELILERYLKDYKEFQDAYVKAMQKHDSTREPSREKKLSKTQLDDQSARDLITEDEETYNTTMEEMRLNDRKVEDQRERSQSQIKEDPDKNKKSPERISGEALIGQRRPKLCNGEVFFIMDEIDRIEERGEEVKYMVLSDRDPELPRVVCVPLKDLRRHCRMKHSWARTIHTYQGSESDTVVYVLGKAMPQNWQHVYTAVTRGKKSVYIIGSHSELLKAVYKREPHRNTRLGHRLKEMIAQNDDLIRKIKQEFYSKRTQNSTTSPEDVLSDLSESFIQELDETVAKFTASCSTSKGRKHSDKLDELYKFDANSQTGAAVLNSLIHGHAELHAGLDCSDSDIFADDIYNVKRSQPTPIENIAGPSTSAYASANELNETCKLTQTKRRIFDSPTRDGHSSSTSDDSPSNSSLNEVAMTTPKKDQSPLGTSAHDTVGASPSKRICMNVLSTPFQDSFRNSLSLKTDKSNVCKKL